MAYPIPGASGSQEASGGSPLEILSRQLGMSQKDAEEVANYAQSKIHGPGLPGMSEASMASNPFMKPLGNAYGYGPSGPLQPPGITPFGSGMGNAYGYGPGEVRPIPGARPMLPEGQYPITPFQGVEPPNPFLGPGPLAGQAEAGPLEALGERALARTGEAGGYAQLARGAGALAKRMFPRLAPLAEESIPGAAPWLARGVGILGGPVGITATTAATLYPFLKQLYAREGSARGAMDAAKSQGHSLSDLGGLGPADFLRINNLVQDRVNTFVEDRKKAAQATQNRPGHLTEKDVIGLIRGLAGADGVNLRSMSGKPLEFTGAINSMFSSLADALRGANIQAGDSVVRLTPQVLSALFQNALGYNASPRPAGNPQQGGGLRSGLQYR